MADPLGEILRSPLDEMPEPRFRSHEVLAVAIALMLGIATGWIAGAPDDPVAVATTITTTTTTPAELPDLPPGFVDTGLGGGASVSWIYTRGSDLLVGVAIAAPVDAPPTDVGATGLGDNRRGMGIWTVHMSGGERVDHTREMFDATAPGIVTVEFAGLGAPSGDVRSLTLRPVVGTGSRNHNVNMPIGDLPARLTTIAPLEATELVEQTATGVERSNLTWVTIDRLTIDWTNATAEWTLDDPGSVRAMLDMAVTLEGETTNPVSLVAVSGGAAFLQREAAPVSPTRSGVTMLKKQPGTGQADYEPESAEIAITISWLRYGPDAIEIPLEAAILLDSLE